MALPLPRSSSRRHVVSHFAVAAVAGSVSCLLILAAMVLELALVAEAQAEVERVRLEEEEGWAEAAKPLPADASLEQVVERIRRARVVTSALVGYNAQESPVYGAFVRLAQLADEAQLRALVEDQSPAVRVYAFLALSRRQPSGIAYQVLLDHADDRAWVSTFRGCIGDRSTVFAAMLYEVDHLLSPAQVSELNMRAQAGPRDWHAGR